MVLRIASPTKRKGSDNWYYRRTIPADVQRLLAGLPTSQKPANWYKTHLSISLRTADRTVAKAKAAEVAAAVDQQFRALREGPNPLTSKQITALSVTFVSRFPPPTEILTSVQPNRTLTGLAEAWHSGALARNVRPRDAKQLEGGRAFASSSGWAMTILAA
jgi:hypothetical protein